MDRGVRIRTPDRGFARPPNPPRSYPRDERRQLPPEPEPKTADPPKNLTNENMVDPVGPQAPPALLRSA